VKNPQTMQIRFVSAISRNMKGLIVGALLSGTTFSQEVSIAALNAGAANGAPPNLDSVSVGLLPASPVLANTLPEAPSQHRFWDSQNRILFAAVAALSAADFAVTRSILQNGGRELNPVTRLFSGSTAGLAVNFAGETAGIIGLSYYFHKTGHHQLERITPMLNIGASSFAVVYDLSHR